MSTTGSEDGSFSPNNSTSSADDNNQFNSSNSTDSSENGAKKKLKRNYRRMEDKPPFSYQALIIAAIQTSDQNKMTLKEIFLFLERSFSFFRGEYRGWRDSIRHNLTSSPVFEKVLKDPKKPNKKSNFWRVRYEKVSCIVMRDITAIQLHLGGLAGSVGVVSPHHITRLRSFAGIEGGSSSQRGLSGQQGLSALPGMGTGKPGTETAVLTGAKSSAAESAEGYQDKKLIKKSPKNAKAFLMESILKTPFQEKHQNSRITWPDPAYYSTPIGPMEWIENSERTPSNHAEATEGSQGSVTQGGGAERSAGGGASAGGGIFPFSAGSIYSPSTSWYSTAFTNFLNQQSSYGFTSPGSFIPGHNFGTRDGLDSIGSSRLEQLSLPSQFFPCFKPDAIPGITSLYNPIDCLENMNVKYSM